MSAPRSASPREPQAFNREMVERARRYPHQPEHSPAQAAAQPQVCPVCPILDDQTRIGRLSEDLVRAMRQLRRDLAACTRCPSYENCPVLQKFQTAVQVAIQEVLDEWNLDFDPPTGD